MEKKKATTMASSESNDLSAPATLSRKLEITAISAEGLVHGRKPVKKNAYVSFDIPGSYRPMRTNVDEMGGSCPMWEEKLDTEFMLESIEPGFMYVRVYCGQDKHVGSARVPIKVFAGEYAPEGFLHCLSYRLWDDYGRRNGIINFSARIVPPGSKGGEVCPFWLR